MVGRGVARLMIVCVAVAAGSGCLHGRKKWAGDSAGPQAEVCDDADRPTIRVKAPPQKIVIEQEDAEPDAESRKGGGKPESAPLKSPRKGGGRPESARLPPEDDDDAEGAELSPAAGLALASQGLNVASQITGFQRTTAMTNPLGTVTPGSAGLGIGMRWIHIPIPFPRLFSIQENPSVTIPLNEANLVAAGGQQQVVAGGAARPGLSREELAAIVEQEIARRRRANPPAPKPVPADADEKKRLEKKLAEAEAKIERMSNALDSIDEKLGKPKPAP